MTTTKPEKPARRKREPVKYTVTIEPMTEKQLLQYARNLIQAGMKIAAEREAANSTER